MIFFHIYIFFSRTLSKEIKLKKCWIHHPVWVIQTIKKSNIFYIYNTIVKGDNWATFVWWFSRVYISLENELWQLLNILSLWSTLGEKGKVFFAIGEHGKWLVWSVVRESDRRCRWLLLFNENNRSFCTYL